MRSGLLALLFIVLAGPPGWAQPRLPMSRMLCADVVDLVKRQGDVKIAAGSGALERFVRDRSFCDLLEIAELRFVATRDNPQCPIGYRCREPDYEDWNWD